MTQASGGDGDLDRINRDVTSTAAETSEGSLPSSRHSLPAIGTRGIENPAVAPLKRLRQNAADAGGGDSEQTAVAIGGVQNTAGPHSGGAGEGVSDVAKGGVDGDVGAATAADAAAAVDAATAAAAAATAADAAAKIGDAQKDAESGGPLGKQAENHLSCKYTKEEFIARQWGMNLLQMKRVKALLRMGVCEEDLEIADRLLKMGRDISNDTPLTKEEQLLGYTAHQRQRIKALQILGLTEESFERCRAVMLGSLGPSAFGYNADETAASVASAEAEEGWTPMDKFRKKLGVGIGGGGGHHGHGMLRMPTFGNPSSASHIGNLGGSGGTSRAFATGDAGAGGPFNKYGRGGAGLGAMMTQHMRRRSDSDKGEYLPDIEAGSRKARVPGISAARAVGGGAVAVGMPPLDTIPGSPTHSVAGVLSARTDPG